jgi:hypothetical protein
MESKSPNDIPPRAVISIPGDLIRDIDAFREAEEMGKFDEAALILIELGLQYWRERGRGC